MLGLLRGVEKNPTNSRKLRAHCCISGVFCSSSTGLKEILIPLQLNDPGAVRVMHLSGR